MIHDKILWIRLIFLLLFIYNFIIITYANIFYTPEKNIYFENSINKNMVILCSFCGDDFPHFAKTCKCIISKVYDENIEIIIEKKQKLENTSSVWEGINLESGLLLNSIFEDDNIVVFKIPKNYIWCISNLWMII